MNFCEGGDLYTKLKSQKGQLLEETQIVEWFVQIAMALQVHTQNIYWSLTQWCTAPANYIPSLQV